MTNLEITRLCAEAMGWRTFLEKRGEYSLCVAVSPGGRMPWEGRRNPDPERYKEVSLKEAGKIGFFGQALPNPLEDDAQAMALVKKFRLRIEPNGDVSDEAMFVRIKGQQLNRAICECVAKMQAAK